MTEPLQKPGRSRQDYGTPPAFLEAVKQKLGIADFDCDLAASRENAVTARFLSIGEDDALEQDSWRFGTGWNWLNPPFANIARWVDMAHHEWFVDDVRTAMLIPASVGSNWWARHVHNVCCVQFISPRLTFVGCADPYPKDCALLLYGHDPGYDVWTWKTPKAVHQGSGAGDPAVVSS
jgi:phage N-6-adenine-methyltransferase